MKHKTIKLSYNPLSLTLNDPLSQICLIKYLNSNIINAPYNNYLSHMQITREVKNLLQIVNSKVNFQPSTSAQPKLTLPSKDLSLGQLAELLSVLAKEYNTTLPVLIRKLDRVSGDVRALDRIYTEKDDKAQWTPQEDGLLTKNAAILSRWKGQDNVELRKRYLATKNKR